jgi:NAD-dependent deacetylase
MPRFDQIPILFNPIPMNALLQKAAALISRSHLTIALTGAGISVESGIPPFRGSGGLWEKIDPFKYAHIDAYARNPAEVWEVLFLGLKDLLQKAKPNDGHLGLSQIERMGRLQTVITQNIDGLHQRAGSRDVIEFHGTFAELRCMRCDGRLGASHAELDPLPPRCACGGILRPDVVMFGERIPEAPLQRAQMLASTCDLMLVVGTSATVEPASYLPVIAKRGGAAVIEINPEATPLTRQVSDVTLLGEAGSVMPQLVRALTQQGSLA